MISHQNLTVPNRPPLDQFHQMPLSTRSLFQLVRDHNLINPIAPGVFCRQPDRHLHIPITHPFEDVPRPSLLPSPRKQPLPLLPRRKFSYQVILMSTDHQLKPTCTRTQPNAQSASCTTRPISIVHDAVTNPSAPSASCKLNVQIRILQSTTMIPRTLPHLHRQRRKDF